MRFQLIKLIGSNLKVLEFVQFLFTNALQWFSIVYDVFEICLFVDIIINRSET